MPITKSSLPQPETPLSGPLISGKPLPESLAGRPIGPRPIFLPDRSGPGAAARAGAAARGHVGAFFFRRFCFTVRRRRRGVSRWLGPR